MSKNKHHPIPNQPDPPMGHREQIRLPASPDLSCRCCGAAPSTTATSGSPAIPAVDACPPRLSEVHRAYLAGLLSEELAWKIDMHLLRCRRCENTWDALTSSLEDGMLSDTREDDSADESEGDCPGGLTRKSHPGAARAPAAASVHYRPRRHSPKFRI